MKITYRPKGVCSQLMDIEVEDGKIESVKVTGGCSGNLQGISSLLKGMDVDEAISRMEGIRCGFKATSCPDQIAQALKQYKNAEVCAHPAAGLVPALPRPCRGGRRRGRAVHAGVYRRAALGARVCFR